MHVTKEGIERIKSANELAAIVAERGIEVKKKGKSLVARVPSTKRRHRRLRSRPRRDCSTVSAAGCRET